MEDKLTMSEMLLRLNLLDVVAAMLGDQAGVLDVSIEAVVQSTGQRIKASLQIENPNS
jgi:hypothetical protein